MYNIRVMINRFTIITLFLFSLLTWLLFYINSILILITYFIILTYLFIKIDDKKYFEENKHEN